MGTRVWLLVWLCLSGLLTVAAQRGERPWESVLREVMTVEDGESADWEETLEMLTDLEEDPIDINTATREQLEMLCFLSAQQVEDIGEYLHRHGAMKSLGELRMIRSLDYAQIQLLPHFVYIGEERGQRFPGWDRVARYGQHDLMAYARVPFYERQGDKNGYLGYPYKHWTQYKFHYGDYVKAGVVGAQDAGEPFFASGNAAGYDFYSYYVELRRLGRLETAVVGKYKLSVGMGLVANNSFGLGKLATLQNLGRSANMVRAHSSRSSSDYFQGAAATLRLAEGLTATGFVSYRPLDATLNDSGQAQTIVKDGYHRTPAEMQKKGNTHAAVAGANLNGRYHGFHVGATAIYTHLDRRLQPATSALYRRYYARGCDFLNLSTDYGYASRRLSLNGETAVSRNGAVATVNSVSLLLADELSLMALQRFYSYRYTSLYGRSFSEGSGVQNESGVYVGLTWQPSPLWRLQAYADYAYFAWPKYQVSRSSHAADYLLQLAHTRSHWRLQGRYRLHLKQRDNDGKTALASRTEHRARLALTYSGIQQLSLTTQADGCLTTFEGSTDRGWMASQQASYTYRWLQLGGSLSYFDTDSYDSRLYVYERGLLYSFNFPMLYGRGLRYMVMGRAGLGSRLTVSLKVGVSNYFDRATIGTGRQTIDGSSQADLDLQVRWKI